MTAARNGIEIKLSSVFFVEGEIANMNVRLYRWLLWRAARHRGEVEVSVYREAAGLKVREMGKIQIASSEIGAKRVSRKVHRAVAGHGSVVHTCGQVGEVKFVSCEPEIASQQRDGRLVNCGFANFDVTLPLVMGGRAGGIKRPSTPVSGRWSPPVSRFPQHRRSATDA